MKSYGQYCGLAKALDHVGDRWTLLIVRELMIGRRRYSGIRDALPRIATNLLADRLRDLTEDGVISRHEDGSYELTEFGRGLEDAVYGLIRWGGRWMTERGPREDFRAEWLAVALEALLPDRPRSGRIEIHVDGAVLSVEKGRVEVGEKEDPDAVVEGTPEAILGVAAGELPLSTVRIRGDRRLASRFMRPGPRRAQQVLV